MFNAIHFDPLYFLTHHSLNGFCYTASWKPLTWTAFCKTIRLLSKYDDDDDTTQLIKVNIELSPSPTGNKHHSRSSVSYLMSVLLTMELESG